MNFTGKVTAVTPVSGTNRYGEAYSGNRITVVEQNAEEGHARNACTLYVPDTQNAVIKVGDVGSVECVVDIKQGNNGAYNTINCRNFTLITPETF